jgi:pimeloyl-ACP methyl ester carboxylesterase
LAIPDNGHKLAQLLESVLDVYPSPLEEILLIGYSMGGLVVRSACHTANLEGKRWLELVRRAIYVGTPHRGVPLERAGRVLSRLLHEIGDPYTRLVAELGDLRSSGVKDLGNAVLRHEDRIEKSLSLLDPRHPAALLPQLRHYLVAGAVVNKPLLRSLFGDAVVSISSATDGCAELRPPGFASGGVKVVGNIGHLALAHHPQVYEQIRAWCQECS